MATQRQSKPEVSDVQQPLDSQNLGSQSDRSQNGPPSSEITSGWPDIAVALAPRYMWVLAGVLQESIRTGVHSKDEVQQVLRRHCWDCPLPQEVSDLITRSIARLFHLVTEHKASLEAFLQNPGRVRQGAIPVWAGASNTEAGSEPSPTPEEWSRLKEDAPLVGKIAAWALHDPGSTMRGPRPETRTVKITFGHTRVTVNGKPVNKDASWLLAEYLILKNGRVCWPWVCVILPTFDVADPDGAFRNYLSKKRRTFNGCGIHFATHKKKTEDGTHVFEGMDDNIVSNIKNVKTMHDQALKEYEAGDRARAISLLSRITGDDQNDWYMFTAAYMDLARWICELHFEHVGERPIEKCRSFLTWYCKKLRLGPLCQNR
ncbi:MAG TPA: hypothetical protein VLH56_05885 [Dissulfurispiraceae bacterium]|nr:hypothetical protein [Dissulfurispiraceae bacterium]